MSYAELKNAFIGFQHSFEEAEVVVIPVPYEGTVTYGTGTSKGPEAIIDSSNNLEVYDIELGSNIFEKLSIHTLDELEVREKTPEEMLDIVSTNVKKILNAGKKPVVLGGEHSITSGALSAFEKPISVLQIDAHSDLRDSYDGTKNSHACAMRRAREITKDTVQVGIRSMCREEAEYIEKEGIQDSIFYAGDLQKNKKNNSLNKDDIEAILSHLKNDVYLTVDVDGFDPSVIPGTGTPEPGGLLWYDVLSLIKSVSKEKNVVGFDIVEVAPIPNLSISEFTAAKLAYKMMGYFWAKS